VKWILAGSSWNCAWTFEKSCNVFCCMHELAFVVLWIAKMVTYFHAQKMWLIKMFFYFVVEYMIIWGFEDFVLCLLDGIKGKIAKELMSK